jgi:hypothetical protein
MKVEDLTASYWTGAAPCPRPVREIGMAGAVIETDDAYYPGTLMHVILDALDGAHSSHPAVSFAVWARVVRKIPKGICVEFLFKDRQEIDDFQRYLENMQRREQSESIDRKRMALNEGPVTG